MDSSFPWFEFFMFDLDAISNEVESKSEMVSALTYVPSSLGLFNIFTFLLEP